MNKFIRSLFVFLFIGFLVSAQDTSSKYTNWSHAGSIFILTTPEGANLPDDAQEKDFPLLVRLTNDFFDFSQAQPEGQDLRFSSDSGLPLSYQIEDWDVENGKASIWVRIPIIRGNERQEIHLHWGNPKAITESSGAAVFNQSNGFLSVWHLNDTVEDEVGTVISEDRGSVRTNGVIASGRAFSNGTHIYCGDTITTYPSEGEERTTTAWIYANQPGWAVDWGMEARCQENSIKLGKPPVLKNEGYLCDVFGKTELDFKKWYHATITYKDGNLLAYVNGREDGRSVRQFVTPDTAYMRIGQRHNTSDNPWGKQWWDGSIDEVRISNVARSADWIKMEYENQCALPSLLGPLVQSGNSFSISDTAITLTEGERFTLSARAEGALKIKWILRRNGVAKLAAVDQLSYVVNAGRVSEDQNATLIFKAIYQNGVKTKEIQINIIEEIPDPVFELTAPVNWDGRETIEVIPVIANQDQMNSKGVGELNLTWKVSEVAVIKEINGSKLILKRAQNSGLMEVKLTMDNGGQECTQSIAIRVSEPEESAWLQKHPEKNEKPVNNQFYARNDQNKGTVYYNGRLKKETDLVILRIFADDQKIHEESQIPGPDLLYSFTTEIEAGLVNYRIELWSKKRKRERLLERASSIICGDAYLIDGQSNAEAYDYGRADNPYTSDWLRSFGSSSGDPEKSAMNRWGNAVSFDKDSSSLQIGYWGIELGKILIEKHKIPICIINGAVGGSRIDQHQRNSVDPEDANTIYGRMLRRVRQAGLSHGIRGVLWHQGENDQGADGPDIGYGWENYQQYFVDMAAAWKSDYPNIQQYYIFQIWPDACSMGKDGSGDRLREVQRTLPDLFSNMSIMSTLGIRPGGGCHFPPEGYAQMAYLIAPLLERDNYGQKLSRSITPPALLKTYFTNNKRDEIVLEFNQEMNWNDSLVSEFLLDGEKGLLASGTPLGNKIVLKLKTRSNAHEISYLDGKDWDENNILWGKNGIAALTFYAVPIKYLPENMLYPKASLERSPIGQPYPYISKGSFSGRAIPESPDPLVSYRWPNPNAMDGLEIYTLKPTQVDADHPESFVELSSLSSDEPLVTVKGIGSIRMDFGTEMPAWIEFDSPDCPGGIEMSISEYKQPGINKTREPEKIGNTYRLNLNDELYDGVRYAWIHVKSHSAEWHITDVRAVNQVKPTNYKGSFSCSDPMLTKIWYMSAYSVKASFCEDYFGAIIMDRGDRMSWTGDAHPIQAASLVAFGNYDFVKRNLDNSSTQSNGIRSYSLYWVLSLLDYYQYSGDQETLENYIVNASEKLDEAYSVFGTDPHLRFYGWDERLCAGFELWFKPAPEAQKAYEMLSIRVWEDFARTMGQIGREDLQTKYSGYAHSKLAEVRKRKNWLSGYSLHSSTDAVTTQLLTQKEQGTIFKNYFQDRVNRISISPFNQYFVIQAMAQMNKYDEALGSVRDHWGGMVNNGATTTYEVYRPSWNEIIEPNDPVPNSQSGIVSLCHPWGAGPVKWLNEEILGIIPTKAGFENYDILPHPGRTLTWISGSTPTPFGELSASFNLITGSCQVNSPYGTTGRIGIPKAEKSITNIAVNGELAWDGDYHAVHGIEGATEDADFVYFTSVKSGIYDFAVTYQGSTPPYLEPPVQYAAEFVGQDTITSGSWGKVYGKDGYVLCNYEGDGHDKVSLPAYVDSVHYFRAFPVKPGNLPEPVIWAKQTNDDRALAPSANNETIRNAAGYSNVDQTMTFTANVKGTKEFQIALYFVDWDDKGASQGVEMFDAKTLKLIAPVKMIDKHGGGKYLVYTYNKSVKFRINRIRGERISLSGIFFDPKPAIL